MGSQGGDRIIHHIQWQYHSFREQPFLFRSVFFEKLSCLLAGLQRAETGGVTRIENNTLHSSLRDTRPYTIVTHHQLSRIVSDDKMMAMH